MLLFIAAIALPLFVIVGVLALQWRKRVRRKRFPKDYAYAVYRGARGKDLYAAMERKLPWLTPNLYRLLLTEFTAVDMTVRALASRTARRTTRGGSRQLREAFQQLHPFLVHEGLERAIRATRRRVKRIRVHQSRTGSAGRK